MKDGIFAVSKDSESKESRISIWETEKPLRMGKLIEKENVR
jgi:hypothetical protein